MATNQASADTATKPAAASAEASTTQQQSTPDLQARIDAANTPEELAAATREFFETEGKSHKTEEQATAAGGETETTDEGEAEEQAGGEASAEGAGDEQEQEEKDKTAEESAAEEDDEDDKDETDGADASAKSKKKPYRLRGSNDVEDRAFELKKRNRDLSLEECLARAKKEILGEEPKNTEETPAADGMPATIEDAQAKLKELRAAKSKAMRDELDLAKADELDLEMEKVRDHMMVLERRKITEQTRAEQKYLQEFGASQEKASSLYQFLSDEKSAGFIRAREIDELMKEEGDPTFHNPNKPLIIAQMVAAELRIAPKSKKSPAATAPATKPTMSAPAPKPASVISSGGSRTVTQSTQSGQQAAAIDAAQSFDDLRKLGVVVD
jgi:hypothetical protein